MGADIIQTQPTAVEMYETWLNSKEAEINTYFNKNIVRLLEEHWETKGGPHFTITMKSFSLAERDILRQCFIDAGFTINSLVCGLNSTSVSGNIYYYTVKS